MKRRTFIQQLGLAASLPWLGIPARAASNISPIANPNSLKILTCNVRVDVAADALTGDAWADRKELCAEVIRAHHPDLIGFQEVQNRHFHDLKTRLPGFDTFGLANPGAAFDPADAIFFSRQRFELISAGGFWLSDTPHVAGSKSWDSARSRFANWVQLKDRQSGKELRFWNTHLDHIGQEAREKGAAMIVQACQVFPKDYPQLLTGDLNAGPTNPAIRILKEGGWLDTYAAIHGLADPGFTYHAFNGARSAGKNANGTARQKIDWIFCRGTLKPLAAAIIRDSHNGHYPSDHYFVSAEVAL